MLFPRWLLPRGTKAAGLAPGTMVYVGKEQTAAPRLSVFHYNADQFVECEIASVKECAGLVADQAHVTWLNIDGIHDTALVAAAGDSLKLHPLTLEDIVNTSQRPKLETFDNYLFIVLKMLRRDPAREETIIEQVSFVLQRGNLISFQETVEGDVFDPVRQRIRENKGRQRNAGADYLAYSLLDAVVDGYFHILEGLGNQVSQLDEELLSPDPEPDVLNRIHAIKREIAFLRTAVWPLREIINGLDRDATGLITAQTRPFLRDLYDHTIQVIETVESFRDVLAGMTDLYLSRTSNRLNEIMKELTVISTIFIPLTFIAGVYGMNFRFMPELNQPWAYPALWGLMLAIAGGMLIHFKRRGWF
ncbi:MAG: Magnesium transport protein CorA [Lentisphaerae bacterium ADurb.BinA184]|nr:MAG: Magnesium transport protein CorA [Lentisphaerae bacterium ADurb.BinA184]